MGRELYHIKLVVWKLDRNVNHDIAKDLLPACKGMWNDGTIVHGKHRARVIVLGAMFLSGKVEIMIDAMSFAQSKSAADDSCALSLPFSW